MKPEFFFAATNIVVVDRNSENADIDNPNGYIYGFEAILVAEDADGNRVAKHFKTARWEEEILSEAGKQAEALIQRLATGRLPIDFDTWYSVNSCYGSTSYQNEESQVSSWERENETCY